VEDGGDVTRSEGPDKLRLPESVTVPLTVTESASTLGFTDGAAVPEADPPPVFTDGAAVTVEVMVRFPVTLRVPSTAEVLPVAPPFATLPVTVCDPPAPDGPASEPVLPSVSVPPTGIVTAELLPLFGLLELFDSAGPLLAVLPDVDGGASWLDVPFPWGIWPLKGVPAFRFAFAWAARMWAPGLVTGEAWKNESPVTDGATKKVAPAMASPLRTSVHAAGTPRERRREARMDYLLERVNLRLDCCVGLPPGR
jgi:hypothetical protein